MTNHSFLFSPNHLCTPPATLPLCLCWSRLGLIYDQAWPNNHRVGDYLVHSASTDVALNTNQATNWFWDWLFFYGCLTILFVCSALTDSLLELLITKHHPPSTESCVCLLLVVVWNGWCLKWFTHHICIRLLQTSHRYQLLHCGQLSISQQMILVANF